MSEENIDDIIERLQKKCEFLISALEKIERTVQEAIDRAEDDDFEGEEDGSS